MTQDSVYFEQGDEPQEKPSFEETLFKYRFPVTFLLVGVILAGAGVFLSRTGQTDSSMEILSTSESATQNLTVVVEVSGAVEKPGVYELSDDARVEDALIAAGGISVNADRGWMERVINRAAKVVDGQKIYIPKNDEQSVLGQQSTLPSASNSTGGSGGILGGGQGVFSLININTATAKTLESMWGIGPVTAQNIIEQRPYSSVEELLSKKILKSNVYEKNKDLMTVY